MSARAEIETEGLADRIGSLPGFEPARVAAARAGCEAYLVGGAVRDALLGRARSDLDVVVVGDHLALAGALGGSLRVHDRFSTATVTTPGWEVDVVRARAESYPHPGALPEVEPADLPTDLRRRDFSINALAVSLTSPGRLIDPCRGLDDLRDGVLRLLHPHSVIEDPTRALRGARYAARLALEPVPETAAQLRGADLSTISADRVAAELHKAAKEPDPRAAFELLAEWGVLALGPEVPELIGILAELTERPAWHDLVTRPEAVLAALDPDLVEAGRALSGLNPGSPSRAVEACAGHTGVELALARAMGAAWLDDYVQSWRGVELEIGGDELISAGVPEGEAIGRGLAAALRAKLDGEALTDEDELRIALVAAGGSG